MKDGFNLKRKELQVLWMIGTLERLCTLGYINYSPYRLTTNSVDVYTTLNPRELFSNDAETCELLSALLQEATPPEHQEQLTNTLRTLSVLVLDYKKDPYKIVKKGLENLV